MNITIKYRPFQDFGNQKLRDTYRRVPCGDHQYVRFLEGLGAPRQQALRFAKPIEMNLPRGKPIESLIPFMGHWVPFVIPQEHLQTKVWKIGHGKLDIGLEWTINNQPVGLESYGPADWTRFDSKISNLYVGGHAWPANLRHFPGEIRNLPNLESVALANCDSITSINNLIYCKRLRHLFLALKKVTDLSVLSLMPIETLVLMDLEQLTDLEFIRKMPALKTLVVRNCRKLWNLSDLAGKTSLRHLLLDGLPIKSLNPVAEIPGLESLHLATLRGVQKLPQMQAKSPPRSLFIRDCPTMADPGQDNRFFESQSLRFEGIRRWDWLKLLELRSPQTLGLVNCGIDDDQLASLPITPSLTFLDLSHNIGITQVKPLVKAKNLHTLYLDCCMGLQSLSGLNHFKLLEDLSLNLCSNLVNLQPIGNCKKIKSLAVAGMARQAQQSDWLKRLKYLRELSLAGWDQVANFNFLDDKKDLYYLDLRGRVFQENSKFIVNMTGLCYLMTTFSFNMISLKNEGPEHLRPLRAIPGTQGSESFLKIRESWWDIPREKLWNPGLLSYEGHSQDLMDQLTTDMISLIPKVKSKDNHLFFSNRPRPGSPPDLVARAVQPVTPQAESTTALVKQLMELSWANNPFDAGNGYSRMAWELALEYELFQSQNVTAKRNPDGSLRGSRHILLDLIKAMGGISVSKPGGGPKATVFETIVLKDPNAPNKKMEAKLKRDWKAHLKIIKNNLRYSASEGHRGRRATQAITPPNLAGQMV